MTFALAILRAMLLRLDAISRRERVAGAPHNSGTTNGREGNHGTHERPRGGGCAPALPRGASPHFHTEPERAKP